MKILSIDPGKNKCGIAILDSERVYFREVIKRKALAKRVNKLCASHKIEEVIIGNGTGSEDLIQEMSYLSISVKEVAEHFTTLEARKRYWAENPPKGLLRFIPTSLLFPPRPVDDYAAVLLGERYLKG